VIGATCMLLCGLLLRILSRSGPWVRGRHSAFPAPSWLKRVERSSKARAKSVARTRARVRCLTRRSMPNMGATATVGYVPFGSIYFLRALR